MAVVPVERSNIKKKRIHYVELESRDDECALLLCDENEQIDAETLQLALHKATYHIAEKYDMLEKNVILQPLNPNKG